MLAAEIPDLENGGVAKDGMSVTWKLKKGVEWHDGTAVHRRRCRVQLGVRQRPRHRRHDDRQYKDLKAEKIDDFTVRLHFQEPTPFWAAAFTGQTGMIIPKHLFAAYKGGNSREAPANLKPVGTGPYKFVDFKPGDIVRGERNPNYHEPNRPFFDAIEMKGGGDAVSAARAVIQTGEYDFAWNMQVEDQILLSAWSRTPARMAASRSRRAAISSTSN